MIEPRTDKAAMEKPSFPRRLGRIAQGVVVGSLLLLAVLELIAQAGDITPFKYQGF